MFIKEKMRKVKLLKFMIRTKTTNLMQTKDGRLCMLIKLSQTERKDSINNLVSISTDHSTLDQECQCKELLNAMEPTMFG
jgi:hypothetical protein